MAWTNGQKGREGQQIVLTPSRLSFQDMVKEEVRLHIKRLHKLTAGLNVLLVEQRALQQKGVRQLPEYRAT